jgi:hypothetical protein
MLKTSTFRVAATLAAICLCGPAWALGSTPVTVVNPADIAKAEGIQHPYQMGEIDCPFDPPFLNACLGHLNTPPTQRLVIEFVSAACGLDAGVTFTRASITTNVGAGIQGVTHHLAVPAPPSANISQLVRIYADPATTMSFSVETTANNPGAACIFSLSGQTIDVP